MPRENKRDYDRFPKRLRFSFRCKGDVRWQVAFSRDVSVSGVYLISGKIPSDAVLELKTELGDESLAFTGQLIRGLKTSTQLRRLAKGGFGVRF